MKIKRLRSILLPVISLGIIGAFLYYLYSNADQYRELLHLSAIGITLLLLISLAMPLLNGMMNTYMFQSLGANLSHREGFFLGTASTLANQLPISGGIVTRGFYLKHKYALSYTKYFSAVLALFFCTIAVYGMLGLTILMYWAFFQHITISPLLFAGFGLMASGLLIYWLPLDRIRIPTVLLKWVRQALAGWMLINKNPILVLKLLGLQTGTMLLLAMRYWLAFHMLSQNVTVSQVILFASASVLTQLVSFAPGGLGVREAIVGGIASALGFDPGVSVVAIGLDRLVSTIMVVLIGWISIVVLGKQISGGSIESGRQDV